ncbi:YheT family hydrolase [Bdellovibrio reynosensis]|uniref:Alpha/beta fold hydrolase n=1 Tax=Bdellovibrio reynosensis TaxID=2835041 RepID=A0ABY4CCP5_9BACT|nr:alpha/beta fold hydrolase [Bdellovibrio reynosensis]UOF02738.1 alpha/beta fold hydrolase [Bdellovibrio reynosensis]
MQRLELIPLKAPFWADSGHGQTLWAHFLSSPKLEYLGKNFEVDLPDGDRLFCFYKPGTSHLVISLFHGLSGDVHADYMQRTALLCEQLGHSVVLVNHRGAGHGFAHARHPYHSGRAEDVSAVLAKLREMFPGKKQIAVGYSMSGNMLLCLLGGFKGHVKPDGAITVNAPLNLANGSRNLKQGFNRIYDLRFVNRLRKNIHKKHRHGLIDKKYNIPLWSTVWDMDQIYTAPAGGFKDREDYYQTCSSINYISNIDVPTYVLSALDDPFIMAEDYLNAQFSKSVQVHIEARGGHLGYIHSDKTPLGTNRWLDYYLHEAFKALENTLR